MKTLIAFAIVALMTGCATTGQGPIAAIPIAVACKTADPDVPTYRFQPPYKTVFEGTRDLMGDREASLAYEIQLRAALKSCK